MRRTLQPGHRPPAPAQRAIPRGPCSAPPNAWRAGRPPSCPGASPPRHRPSQPSSRRDALCCPAPPSSSLLSGRAAARSCDSALTRGLAEDMLARDVPAGCWRRLRRSLSAGEGRADAATAEPRQQLGRPAAARLLPPRPHLELEWAPGPPAKAVQSGVSCWECACASTARVGSRASGPALRQTYTKPSASLPEPERDPVRVSARWAGRSKRLDNCRSRQPAACMALWFSSAGAGNLATALRVSDI